MVALTSDPKGRVVSIFVGAVLLPSIALSFLSFHAVPEALREHQDRADQERGPGPLLRREGPRDEGAGRGPGRGRASVGPEALVNGRPEVVQAALERAGLGETCSRPCASRGRRPSARSGRPRPPPGRLPRPARGAQGLRARPRAPRTRCPFGRTTATRRASLRFSFACDYAHRTLLRDYFENDFVNPDQALRDPRGRAPAGTVLYETASHPGRPKFEVKRVMAEPVLPRPQALAPLQGPLDRATRCGGWPWSRPASSASSTSCWGPGSSSSTANVQREMHLSRLKSDFVANVSHELKTPLALIRLFAETLELGRVPSEEKAQQYYRVINKESQRLTQLINNILDFSRIEAGRKEYRFAPADVGRIVDEVLESLPVPDRAAGLRPRGRARRGPARGRGRRGGAVPGPHQPREQRDQVQPRRGRAHRGRGADATGDRLLIAVDRPRDRHRQGGPEARSSRSSTGRRTASCTRPRAAASASPWCSHIMEAHGGSVEVESAPGKGSTFTLVLPVSRRARRSRGPRGKRGTRSEL